MKKRIKNYKLLTILAVLISLFLVITVKCSANSVNNPIDNRKQVSQSKYPYKCIGIVEATRFDEETNELVLMRGTGFIVGPHTIVTAAHVVTEAIGVEFILQNGGRERRFDCTDWLINPSWDVEHRGEDTASAGDWAVLTVDEDLECEAGGSLTLSLEKPRLDRNYAVAGYPMDLTGDIYENFPLPLFETSGTLTSLGVINQVPIVSPNLYQTAGASGGPLCEVVQDYPGVVQGIFSTVTIDEDTERFESSDYTPVSADLIKTVQSIEEKEQNKIGNTRHHIEFYGSEDWHYATLYYEENGSMTVFVSAGLPHIYFFDNENYVELQVINRNGQVVRDLPIRGDEMLTDRTIPLIDEVRHATGYHLRIYFNEPNHIETLETALRPNVKQDAKGKYYEYYISEDMKLLPC